MVQFVVDVLEIVVIVFGRLTLIGLDLLGLVQLLVRLHASFVFTFEVHRLIVGREGKSINHLHKLLT